MSRCLFQSAPRKRLVDEVIYQIQQQILLGHLKTRDKIPSEPELMTLFDVGRSTVREAVKVLANQGLLEVKQGEGTFVIDRVIQDESLEQRLRRANILEVYEVRKLLEIEIAGLAATRRTQLDLHEIASQLEKQRKYKLDQDKNAYVESDLAFHMAVAIATHNHVLTDLYVDFENVTRKAITDEVNDLEIFQDQEDYHEKLCESIKAKNAADAKRWTTKYLEDTIKVLEKMIE
jgi:DNA-binding FadR family transcriptional regulator